MSLEDWTIIGPLCYQGKKDCDSALCTRMIYPDGAVSADCIGYHCSYCDAPCSSQGHHGCEVSETMLAESRRILDEGGGDLPPAA